MSELHKLTDIVKFIGGSQPPKSVFSDTKKDGYVRLIQIRDYKSDNHIVYINKDSTKKFCTKDDIMIGRYGPPVFQILRGIEGAYNVALMKAEPKTDKLLKEYLFRFLQNPSIQNYIIGLSQRSAGQSGVNKEALEQYEMLLPPLTEQQRIVSKLDKLFEKIDKGVALHQKNMDEADLFMASVLNDVFGELEEKYEKDNLDNLTKLITKGTTPTTNGYKFQNNGINFLKIENIVNGEIDLSTIEMFISDEAHLSQKRSQLEVDDVLFSIAGTIGDTAIVRKEHLPMNTNQAVALIRPIEKLNSEFLRRLLSSSISNQTTNKKRGGAIKNVSLTDIKATNIPLPPLNIQQKVVKYLDEVSQNLEKVKSAQLDQMDSLIALKASILDKAFRGEL